MSGYRRYCRPPWQLMAELRRPGPVAASAIHDLYGHEQALPAAGEIRYQMTSYRDKPIRGAAGDVYWSEQQLVNDLWRVGHPVPHYCFAAVSCSGERLHDAMATAG